MAEKKELKLKVDPRNARLHPPHNEEAAEKSLDQLGAGRSVLADSEGVIVAGNLIYAKAVKLGIPIKEVHTKGDKLVVVVRDDLATDDPQRKALALADNQGHLIRWDEEIREWLYQDTEEAIHAMKERSCVRCGKMMTIEGHDACIGTLSGGVISACCGHGVEEPYTVTIRAETAVGPALEDRQASTLLSAVRLRIRVADGLLGARGLCRPFAFLNGSYTCTLS